MPLIDEDEAQSLRQAGGWFRQSFLPGFFRVLDQNLPSGVTRVGELRTLYESVDQLIEQCTFKDRRFADVKRRTELEDDLIPCAKRILITRRRHEAEADEIHTAKTHNQLVIDKIEQELRHLDRLLQLPWLKIVKPLRMPRISDFLSVESIQESADMRQLPGREFDEKFHILQSPRLVLLDLEYYRVICEARGLPVAVAYLDIDDFKKFNTAHGEIEVDRWLLPHFMRTLEGHVFGHDFAFREGGDEYIIILPNFSKDMATYFLRSLRNIISTLTFRHIEATLSVSMGFCSIDPDCAFTNREIRTLANRAKTFAKEQGKDSIATYVSDNFEDEALSVLQ